MDKGKGDKSLNTKVTGTFVVETDHGKRTSGTYRCNTFTD